MNTRFSFSEKVRKAVRNPGSAFYYLKRKIRNARLRAASANFLDYYSRIVDANSIGVNPDLAIGSDSSETWEAIGEFQFDYLLRHGLQPSHKVLDIGCGNLRLGSKLIQFSNSGCYVGLDISREVIDSALENVARLGLAKKRPYLYLVRKTDYSFLPENFFDHVQAHSVFSHLPLSEIGRVLREVHRVLAPEGRFDFTYFESDEEREFLDEDFYYPASILFDLCEASGFVATQMADWDYPQKKIRVVKKA